MALIKKFRIKEFKNKKPIAKLEKISLSFDTIMPIPLSELTFTRIWVFVLE